MLGKGMVGGKMQRRDRNKVLKLTANRKFVIFMEVMKYELG